MPAWAAWKISRQGPRPDSAPRDVGKAWVWVWPFLQWVEWRLAGATGKRPATSPETIPPAWWDALHLIQKALPHPDPVTEHPLHRRSAWVNVPENAGSATIVPLMGKAGADLVFVPLAFGLDIYRSANERNWSGWAGWVSELAKQVTVAGWAWGTGVYPAEEGAFHARLALDCGLHGLCSNLEEPYDAHGDWSSPKVQKCRAYADAFRKTAPNLPWTISTTGLWAGDHNAFQSRTALYMPQCYVLENAVDVTTAVNHAVTYGWSKHLIAPMLGTYKVGGQRYPAQSYLQQLRETGVNVFNVYTAEQLLDDPDYWATLGTLPG